MMYRSGDGADLGNVTLSFPRLLDQLEQAGNFGFRPGFHQIFKIPVRKPVPEVVNHIKILPPAITDLEAGQGVITHIQTITEFHETPQPGTAPFHDYRNVRVKKSLIA